MQNAALVGVMHCTRDHRNGGRLPSPASNFEL
jgi:hypothetical protein